ncbi:hypothetical protein HDU85_000963 [Gaertneriomyces sp. JEL0708]|nr:hypothetical protein HDU85_000963 [Gaertneriomyces sp. JEL0708]
MFTTQSGSQLQPLLDLRLPQSYVVCRVSPSYNIPHVELVARVSELPPRHITLRVVIGDDEDEYQPALTFLVSRGWLLKQILPESRLAQGLEEYEFVRGIPPPPLAITPLFFPTPFLPQVIKAIEAEVPVHIVPSVLDLGCGSGRDLAYVLSSYLRGGRPWAGLGVDCWKGAVTRAQMLLERWSCRNGTGVLGRITGGTLVVGGEPIPIKEAMGLLPAGEPGEAINSTHSPTLVIQARSLHRSIFPQLLELPPQSHILIHTFIHTDKVPLEHPTDPNDFLLEGELQRVFSKENGWRVMEDVIAAIEDGRLCETFWARRI